MTRVDFATDPGRYRHWGLSIDGPVATLTMDVDEAGGLDPGYELKLNSYDLGVDIELYDAVQRLRFEHPEVAAVVITGGKDKVFSAGANIRMLAGATHARKVNFCKFTNETRNGIEDATAYSGQTYLAALNGAASGGGYEIALAADHIMLVDDGSSAVAFPELPLLGVLPGTGGLTRLVDKRHVRRDIADVFATRAEGVYGAQAVRWGLVDEIVPRSKFAETVRVRALEVAARTDRPRSAKGILLTPLERELGEDEIVYPHVRATIDRVLRTVTVSVHGPDREQPAEPVAIEAAGASYWPLAMCRALDDLVMHLRLNEPELGTLVLETAGDLDAVVAVDGTLLTHADHWLVREIILYLKRTLKRLDVTSRSMVALVRPGSCFAGTLLELALAADRSYMLDGTFDGDDASPAQIALSSMNFGPLPMPNGLTRIESRFFGDGHASRAVEKLRDERLDAAAALEAGLVTFAPDDIDWDDEVRLALEERAGFSPDALTGMEANHRFAGPETLESKIFARLSAWQNWVFQRPNAAGPEGALRRYGTGTRPVYDHERV